MKFLPDAVADFFRKKPSENLLRAVERSRQRQAQTGRFNEGYSNAPSDESASVAERAKGRSNGTFDVKTLVLAVSVAANAGLVGVLYGKGTVSDENDRLRGEVRSLRIEKDKANRLAEGKITLAPTQRIIEEGQLREYVSSAELLMESTKALSEKVVVLEGRLARYEGGKPSEKSASPTAVPAMPSELAKLLKPAKPSDAAVRARNAVRIVSKDMPEGSSLKVVESAEKTLVVYSDASWYSRYFTADHSDNSSKLTEKGLREWTNKKFIESIDVQAKAQGTMG